MFYSIVITILFIIFGATIVVIIVIIACLLIMAGSRLLRESCDGVEFMLDFTVE